MPQQFDLAVIGTGAAAATVAEACRAAKWRVAVVDSRPFGGTCALRGCEPKKVLVAAAEAADGAGRMRGRGIGGGPVRLDWPELMRFKRTFTDPVPRQREQEFAAAGIAMFHGRARFTGPAALQVASGPDGPGEQDIEARYAVIAAGAKPARLNLPGEELLATSEDFLNLEQMPRRVVFAGGGYISFEFAHVAARAGAAVTILHGGPRPLGGFDPGLVDLLVRRSRDLGIDVRLETAVTGLEKTPDGVAVLGKGTQGRERFAADLAVHGAGRVPEIDGLELAAAGIAWDARKGITVNEYLQSVSNPRVYAAGDAAASGGLPLTPVASYEGGIAAANLLRGNQVKPDYRGVPTVAFAIPPLAGVGLLEAEARKRGLRFRVNAAETGGWNSSRRVGEKYSGFKVLIEEGTERILGAHLLGPAADEVINLFAVAIRFEIPAPKLKAMIFSYPTHGSDVTYML